MQNTGVFVADSWQSVFEERGLAVAADWWALAKDDARSAMMDDINYRYGGESFVCRTVIADSAEVERTVYIKCQRNQWRRTLRHPLKGEPTVCQEFRVLRFCDEEGVPAAKPLFFDSRDGADGERYTVMVTLGLDGFDSLEDINFDILSYGQRKCLAHDAADTLLMLHGKHMMHRNLYGKHMLAAWRDDKQQFDVSFIDMEKAQKVRKAEQLLRDLDSLSRRTAGLTVKDRIRFLQRYLGVRKLDAKGKAMAWELNGKLGKFLERKG